MKKTKAEKREDKKKIKMPVSGQGVFDLKRIIKDKSQEKKSGEKNYPFIHIINFFTIKNNEV